MRFRRNRLDGNSVVDLELLAKGFYIVVGPVPYNADGPILDYWNIVYNYLVEKGFSPKPVHAGHGATTGEVYGRTIENPGKVACILRGKSYSYALRLPKCSCSPTTIKTEWNSVFPQTIFHPAFH